MKNWIMLVICLTLGTQIWAQNATERSDWMRSNGLIFIVIGVLVIIFIGLILYLLLLDRKLKKIEQSINAEEHE